MPAPAVVDRRRINTLLLDVHSRFTRDDICNR
jgi:hypothetical protein